MAESMAQGKYVMQQTQDCELENLMDYEVEENQNEDVFVLEKNNEEMLVDQVDQGHQRPYVGMEFQSLDDAYEFYNNYGNDKGFSIRKSRSIKSRKDNSVIGKEFVCSKEGSRSQKYSKKEGRAILAHDETRNGCKAMLRVAKKDGLWVVSQFLVEHNHEFVSPGSKKFLRSKRKKTEAQKNLIDLLNKSGIRTGGIMSVLTTQSGGIDKVSLTEQDINNYLSGKRQKKLEKGDAQLMLRYFQERQAKNPGFYYAVQMDVEGHLANCFWADARSRIAYRCFGDVVTFDPTYLTNKYHMPFTPFIGVNHHRQSVLFGCALLWDETEESFVWLLRVWQEAMFQQAPKTIITDQAGAIINAVATVLPKTTHHLCMWHIEKKFPEKLNYVYHQNNDFRNRFYKCIHEPTSPQEFEAEWMAIIEQYNLDDIEWLEEIFEIREKWVPAYVRTSFCAGMSTTQRSEGMNKYFKNFLNSSTRVSEFVVQYDRAVDARYNKEKEQNFKTKNSKPILKTMYHMEEEASRVYTRKLFRIFQDELVHSQRYVAKKIDVIEGISRYNVHEFCKENAVFIVNFDPSLQKANCSCHMFEFMGILCRHVLMTFIKKKIHSVPPHYVLDRWTRNATTRNIEGLSTVKLEGDTSTPSTLWFNSIMVQSLQLSNLASKSEKHYEVAMQGLRHLFEELHNLTCEDEKASEVQSKHDKVAEIEGTQTIESCNQNTNITVYDPNCVVAKGCPRTLRMKGALEKSRKKNKKCSLCKQTGHTKPKCSFNMRSTE